MMKAILATLMLLLLPGVGLAEIRLSGSARMGLSYNDGNSAFSSRVRIVFTALGETDGGISFGATVRADQSGGNGGIAYAAVGPGPDGIYDTADDVLVGMGLFGSSGTRNDDSTVFISGRFGKLTMGNVSSAAHTLVGQVSGVGYGPNDRAHELLYIGTIKTAIYYEFNRGAITFGVGAGQLSPSDPLLASVNTYSAAIKYAGGAFSVALGYEWADYVVSRALHLSGEVRLGPTTLKARLSDFDEFGTAYAASVDYATGATTLTAFYATYADLGVTNYGLGVAYDLGNGATLAAGVVREILPTSDVVRVDVGLKFTF